MEKSIYPFSLVDKANEDIKKYGKEIQIVQHEREPQYFCVDILSIGDDGSVIHIVTYADNFFEEELEECVNDAWEYIKEREAFKQANKDYFCYRYVAGGTHDIPALIWSLTDFPLFFRYEDSKEVELVSKHDEGIDYYDGKHGDFCVLSEDYELAMRQIEDHDNRGVEQ